MAPPWDIYAEKLSPLGYGHPLWIPEPSREYGEVRIGDVGFFLDGRFRFLFNCTRESNDPLNLRGTPTPFRPFAIPSGSVVENPSEITQPLLQSHGMHSISAQGQGTVGDPTTGGGAQAGFHYRCTEESGALLILKQAGYATRLDCTRAVQEYMLQNLEHWYLFATDRLGIDLRESDLIFVYGHIKTTVWAEAAFTSSSTDGELRISAGMPTLGASGIFSVELSNRQIPTIFHRWGPPERITAEREMAALVTLPSTNVEDTFDQCIFLNYFKMKRRFRMRMVIRAAAGPHELPRSPPDDLPRELDEAEDSDAQAFDPASRILDYILERAEDVDYAWISDQDVCRTLRQLEILRDIPDPAVEERKAAVDWHGLSTVATALQARIVTDHGLGALAWEQERAGYSIDMPGVLSKDALPRLNSSPDASTLPAYATSPVVPSHTQSVPCMPRNYSSSDDQLQGRTDNALITSLAAPANPEPRELIRLATTLLCREMLKPPARVGRSGLEQKDWEEVEVRLRALSRFQRIWTRSGAATSSSQGNVLALGNGVASGSEERERRLFVEALRDGYVLCQCINKLFPNSITRVDPREDGLLRTSNVKKFLAACSTVGLSSDQLFHRDDLIEATSECLARVAKTVIALSHLNETLPKPSEALVGGSRSDLGMSQFFGSLSPVSPSLPGEKERWNPPSRRRIPTVPFGSPNEDTTNGEVLNNDNVIISTLSAPVLISADRDEAPAMGMSPPPHSLPRARPVFQSIPMDRSTNTIVFPSASLNDSKTDLSVLSSNHPRLRSWRFQSLRTWRNLKPSTRGELGATPRPRSESIGNQRVLWSNASASDLMLRDPLDGSEVGQIVREDGKAPTQFQLCNRIGRGQFGSVYRALELNTRTIVAVKRIRLEGLKEDEISQLMREVDLIRYLSHPSIVQYEGMSRDDTWLNIVLEYVENVSLGQTLKAFGKLNERLVANYVVKILEGLHFLHQNDVVHCDLRAANILTTKNGNVKLSDFGNSLNVRAMEREMKHVTAMPNWMAPEVIELKGVLTKSDIWSLACTVIELLTGRPPYADISDIISVMFRIVEDERPPLPECSESLQSFLKWSFNRNPIKRPNAEQLLEHDWLKKYAGADLEMRDSNRSSTDEHPNLLDLASSPPQRRLLNDTEPISPREHSFVKVTFSKSVICKVCLQSVKKYAVLCEKCSLIAHARCSGNAPPSCDLRAQLLNFAKYAENSSSSPMAIPAAAAQDGPPIGPTSQTSDDGLSQRDSLHSAEPHVQGHQNYIAHSRPAFQGFSAFDRSRPPPTVYRDQWSTTSLDKGRPHFISSGRTSLNSTSMRSAATTSASTSSNRHSSLASGFRSDGLSSMTSFSAMSTTSEAGAKRDDPRLVSGPPAPPSHREKGRDRDGGSCTVQ